AFLGIGRDQTHARGWRQKADRRRINNLKNVEAKSVCDQRRNEKSRGRRFPAPRRLPIKKKRCGRRRRQGSVHRGGVVASATDVIPCSSAAFATSTTVS